MLHVEASCKIQLFFILLDIRSQILNIIYGLDHIYENTHRELLVHLLNTLWKSVNHTAFFIARYSIT